MKTLKKLGLAVMLLGLMCILMVGLGTTASANNLIESGKCGDSGDNVTWQLYDDGLLVISGKGNMEDYTSRLTIFSKNALPPYSQSYYNGDDSDYVDDNFIRKIIINDGVTSIGDCAFSNLCALTSVTIPASVTSIGIYAFEYCKKLTSIKIPDSVTIIGNDAFYHTGYYKNSSNWKNDILYIGKHLVAAKSNIASCKIKKGTLTISEEAFAYCRKLTSITIPDSVTIIGEAAFIGCTGLTNVKIPESVTIIGNSAFETCKGLTSITIPESVTKIDNYTFKGCTGLVKITIPDSVTSIGRQAFYNCSNLVSIKIPKFVKLIDTETFYNCTSLESITISDSVTSIGNRAFYNCTNLENITIPISVTVIGYHTFYNCTSLKNVYYAGTCTQWKKIEKNECSAELKKAEKDFAKPHILKNKVTKATLTKSGKVESKCSVCGESKTTTVYYPKTISLSATKFTYNGKAKAPAVTVRDSKGKTLFKDKDYTVTYSSGKTKVGKYAVTITFKGNYSGTVTKHFLILPGKTSKITPTTTTTTLKATWNKVTGATGYKVEVINSSGNVINSVHTKNNYYTFTGLTTSLNYKIKVTAYKTIKNKNEYSLDSTTVPIHTNPATPTLKVTSSKKGIANLSWSNVAGETGYQVYYSTSKNGTYTKAGVYNANTVKGSKSKLTSGKTYYFKVRAYKKVGNTTIYGTFSSVKSVKIK